MKDTELIQNMKNGEEESLAHLIDRYGAYVAAIAAKVGAGQLRNEDVEEVAADVFVAFWKKIGDFEEGREVKPWLAKAARNAAVSRLRRGGARQEGQALSLDDAILVLEKDATDELALKRERQIILNEAVSSLDGVSREIFARFYYFNEKVDEISKRLSMNPSTVKTKLRRSREKLREAFEERGYTYYES